MSDGERERGGERGVCQGQHTALTQGRMRLTANISPSVVRCESRAKDYL